MGLIVRLAVWALLTALLTLWCWRGLHPHHSAWRRRSPLFTIPYLLISVVLLLIVQTAAVMLLAQVLDACARRLPGKLAAYLPHGVSEWAGPALLLTWGPIAIVLTLLRRRALRTMRPGGQRCLKCDYDLTGVPRWGWAVRCPECGYINTARRLRERAEGERLTRALLKDPIAFYHDPCSPVWDLLRRPRRR